MRAYLDPETGELVVGALPAGEVELDAAMQNALSKETEGLEMKHHADGSVSMDLQGRFQSATVVHIDENGAVTVCSDNVENVERNLEEKVVHPATPEVK
jgi:hypothetical protein